jgi:hypothetical protein
MPRDTPAAPTTKAGRAILAGWDSENAPGGSHEVDRGFVSEIIHAIESESDRLNPYAVCDRCYERGWNEASRLSEAEARSTPAEALPDEARLARAITANWQGIKAAGHKGGPTPLDISRALLARLRSPESDEA